MSEKIIIEPSLLSADFASLGAAAREAEAAGVEAIQIDVMDGQFVPNLCFGPGIVAALRPLVSMKLDLHLMIDEPERYLENFAQAGADRLIVHQEACTHLHRTLAKIATLGVEVGVTINPGTSIEAIDEVLDLVDLVQIMTVNPGFGGQTFIYSQLDKIRRLKERLQQRGKNIPIAVDGGINPKTAPLAVEAGATVLVAGSSAYNAQRSLVDNLKLLHQEIADRNSHKEPLNSYA
ncbi:MAG: ribulose-phosphate 3-epimerase [Cyanobacteria bacterium P01_G01_bin.39]